MRSNFDDNALLAWLQTWYCDQFRSQYILEGYWNINLINSRRQCPACMAAGMGLWSRLELRLEVRVRVRYLTYRHKISFPKRPGKYLSSHVSQSIIYTRIIINPSQIWRSVVITFKFTLCSTHIYSCNFWQKWYTRMILYELIALYNAFPAVPNLSWYFDA